MRSWFVIATFGLSLAISSTALGQGFGTGSSGTGAFGSRSFGSGITGRAGGGGGSPGSQVEQFQADAGTVTGSERFIQANRDATSFVGADRGELAGTSSRQPGANAGAAQSVQRLLSGLAPQQDPNLTQANTNQGRRQLRVQVRIGFPRDPLRPPLVVSQFENRLNRIPQINGGGPIRASLFNSTIVLQGTVDSNYARDLAERIARLEPGVYQVQNDLTVGAANSSR